MGGWYIRGSFHKGLVVVRIRIMSICKQKSQERYGTLQTWAMPFSFFARRAASLLAFSPATVRVILCVQELDVEQGSANTC